MSSSPLVNVSRDGVVQESIVRQREFCDRHDERRGEFEDHYMPCISGSTAQTYCADKIKARCRPASSLRAIPCSPQAKHVPRGQRGLGRGSITVSLITLYTQARAQ
jgi:hypothetical protein